METTDLPDRSIFGDDAQASQESHMNIGPSAITYGVPSAMVICTLSISFLVILPAVAALLLTTPFRWIRANPVPVHSYCRLLLMLHG